MGVKEVESSIALMEIINRITMNLRGNGSYLQPVLPALLVTAPVSLELGVVGPGHSVTFTHQQNNKILGFLFWFWTADICGICKTVGFFFSYAHLRHFHSFLGHLNS